MLKHVTVVYAISNEAAFSGELNRVMELFSDLGERPWKIAAVELDHEIKRLERVKEAIDNDEHDIIPAILAHPDIGNVSSIDEL